MLRKDYIRRSIAMASMKHFSPLVRDAILVAPDFRDECQVIFDAFVNFGKDGVGFQRSVLFDAVKAAFVGDFERAWATDTVGSKWHVQILSEDEPQTVAVANGGTRFLVSHLALLSPDKDARIKVFRHRASEVNLPDSSIKSWERLLTHRAPDYDELGLIQDDFNETPIVVREAIRDNLSGNEVSLNVLVPRSARYYERLVGNCDDETDLESYIREVAAPLMRSNVMWKPLCGYKLSLLLGSQPSISHALSEIEVGEDVLSMVMEWAATSGDASSRAACIEIGLRKISANPSIKEPLSKLIDSFAKNLLVADIDQFTLLSSLFVAVYGELSFRRVLPSRPPFWRKLAAIAQAGMIAREVIANGHNAVELAKWFASVRTQNFALQCYADMRLEPRWFAELGTPEQLKNEFVGRAWMAADLSKATVASQGWTSRLLGEGDSTLISQFQMAAAFLPGPLEGGVKAAQDMPLELAESIRSDLSGVTISATSLMSFANAALVYRPSSELSNLAASAIERADYRLETGDSKVPLGALLFGVAAVSAATRSHMLADALCTVLRKYRKFYPDELSINDSFRIAIVASASREKLVDWTKCVGLCMSDMAFQKISHEDAAMLRSHIINLCNIVPELWATCGQAEAALQAVLGI